MGAAVGQSLPIAVGVLISPLPLVAVVLMLVSGSARANAVAFVATWFVAVGGGVLVVALLAGTATPDDEPPPAWTGWVKVALGVLLLAVAVRQWRDRPRAGAEPPMPRWMASVDRFTPVRAAGLAGLLAVVNPKNLLLVVSGGAAVATAAPGDTRAAVVGAVVFAIIASAGVATPLVVYLVAGDRAVAILDDFRTWMVQHNAVIMAVLLLVIGAKLLGDGVTIL